MKTHRKLLLRRTHAITEEGKHYYRVLTDRIRPGILIFECFCGKQMAIRRSLMARITTGKIGMEEKGFVYVTGSSSRKLTL